MQGQGALLGLFPAFELEHLVGHPVAHQAHAFGAEMELVARALAAQGGDDVGVRHHFRQVRQHDVVEGGADAVHLGILQFAGEERDIVGVEAQFGAEVVMDLLHAARPGGIVRIGLALVQEHSLDHAVLLGDARDFQQAVVGAAAVLRDDGLHPVAFSVDVLLVRILVPELQLGARDGHVDDAHADVRRQVLDHLAAEEIDRTQVVAFPADGRRGRVPMALLPSVAGHVDRRHELEARVVEALVLRRRPGPGLHVGLSEAEVDVEIGVGPLGKGLQAQQQSR